MRHRVRLHFLPLTGEEALQHDRAADGHTGAVEGFLAGALSAPWWEATGRIVFAIMFGLPGLGLIGVSVWKLLHPERLYRFTSITMLCVGLLMVLAAFLASRGRMIGVFILTGFSIVLTIARGSIALGPATSEVPRILPGWLKFAVTCIIPFGWVLIRWASHRRGLLRVFKAASLLLAGGFILYLPDLAAGMGQALGMMTVPPAAKRSIEAGMRLGLPPRFRSLDEAWHRLDVPDVLYVVNFWATWCTPCLKELPEFLALQRELEGNPHVRFLAVNTEDLDRLTLETFIQKHGLTGLEVYTDPERAKEGLGVEAIPVTMLIRNRQLLARYEGYSRTFVSRLRAKIQEYVASVSAQPAS